MTIRTTPTFVQGGSHPAEETRLMLGGMLGMPPTTFAGGAASSNPAHGIVTSTDLAVTQNGTPNMSVNVATGGAFIRGTASLNQGAYHVWNDATVNLTVSAADATNARRDLVIAVVRDAAYSGGTNDARLVVVTGTPAASPSDPSLTAYPNALVLARIAVAAGATSVVTANITDLRPLANVAAKVPAFATYTDRSTAIPSPYNGQLSAISAGWTTNGIEQYNGTSWRLPWNMPWGVLAVVSSTGGSGGVSSETVLQTTPSFTAVANRYYRISFTCTYVGSVAGSLFQFVLRKDNISGTQYLNQRVVIPPSPFQDSTSLVGYIIPTAGSQTVCVTAAYIAGGGGTIALISGLHAQIIVEDMGPSGAPV